MHSLHDSHVRADSSRDRESALSKAVVRNRSGVHLVPRVLTVQGDPFSSAEIGGILIVYAWSAALVEPGYWLS
jgi:hypothetical protein